MQILVKQSFLSFVTFIFLYFFCIFFLINFFSFLPRYFLINIEVCRYSRKSRRMQDTWNKFASYIAVYVHKLPIYHGFSYTRSIGREKWMKHAWLWLWKYLQKSLIMMGYAHVCIRSTFKASILSNFLVLDSIKRKNKLR